jgi:hypothetical protein
VVQPPRKLKDYLHESSTTLDSCYRHPTHYFGVIIRINQFLYLEPLGFGQPAPSQLTATSIIATNQLVETLFSQTQTADIHEGFFVTITPEPKTMTAVAGVTASYGISSNMTNAALSGATYVPTPTPSP